MLRWFLVVALALASARAWAQPAQTASAQAASGAAERRVATLVERRTALARRYEAELGTIDGLKKERASWRRDRELRDRLSDAKETADKLTAVARELAAAQQQLAAARRRWSRRSTPSSRPRRRRRARSSSPRCAPSTRRARAPSRIVLPNGDIDPLADPEELDQQAAALRASEQQLLAQVRGLEQQARDLEDNAKLRKQHDRTTELMRRDDDQPRRNAPQPSRGGPELASVGDPSPPGAPPAGHDDRGGVSGGGGAFDATASFEAVTSIVLADVVAPSIHDALARASRSGDPMQRALAAKKARDAVAARLEQLRKQRAQIEARAKQLRKR